MPGTPLAPPRNFPVAWDDPADAERYWITDLQHHAYPQVPLAHALGEAFPRGMNKAFVQDGPPPSPPRMLTLNGYAYTEYRALPPGPPPRLAGLDDSLKPLARWEQRILPAVEALIAPLKAASLDALSLPELVRFACALPEPLERLGTLHHQAVLPFGMAAGMLTGFCARFGLSRAEVAEMGHGVESLSLASNRQQYALGRAAATDPLLLAVLEESRAGEIEPRLRTLGAPAAALLAGVAAHIAAFGWRVGSLHPFSRPVMDDPTPVWVAHRAAATGAMRDPDAQHAAVARRRTAGRTASAARR